jgi:DNA replication and repair protein RecF
VALSQLDLWDFRNIDEAHLELAPGLNVFAGSNAQGKTSLLEAVGMLARGRSFRTEDSRALIRRGAAALCVGGRSSGEAPTALRVSLDASARRFSVDGHEVTATHYGRHLDVVVYATDRLAVVRGPMRERRQFVDRSAAALSPGYRQLLRDYERVVRQRNAALEGRSAGLDAWDESLVTLGAQLRQRRGEYLSRVRSALGRSFVLPQERYGIACDPVAPSPTDTGAIEALRRDVEARRQEERRAGRSLVGPHRDAILFTIDGVDASRGASSGQARSLLLALTLATLEVYRQEHGRPPIALLDDIDSELDDDRAATLCRLLAARGQALVTTAHEHWAGQVAADARLFRVTSGRFAPA